VINSFHPGYLTAERLAKAKNLKIAITAGIGSDHVDLDAANKTNGGITVAEVTGSNVVSVAEHVVMTILTLVRNFVPAHEQIAKGEWNVAEVAKNEYDLENKVVGTVAVGRIGERVLRRLKPFDCKELLYFDYQPLSAEKEKEIGCRRVENLEEMLAQCDVVTINCPLHEKTRGLFNKDLISKMKKGSWLVNTARGAIVVKEDIAQALKDGHLRGYGGDVWFPQPAPKDHPLRYAQNPWGGGNAMVPHMSGTSIDAQKVSIAPLFELLPNVVLTSISALRRRHQGHPRRVLLRPRELQARGPHRLQGRLRHQGVRSARRQEAGFIERLSCVCSIFRRISLPVLGRGADYPGYFCI
jgi:formate dehydrogenase